MIHYYRGTTLVSTNLKYWLQEPLVVGSAAQDAQDGCRELKPGNLAALIHRLDFLVT